MLVEKLTEVHKSQKEIKNSIDSLLGQLSEQISEDHDLIKALTENYKNIELPIVKLPVIGRVKAGKSTLLSAIMGPSSHADFREIPPLHIDKNEATAVIIRIAYGEIPAVLLEKKTKDSQGKTIKEEIDFGHYLKDFKVSQNQEEHQRKFEDVNGFYVQYPNELLKLGIHLEDLPGLDANAGRTQIALDTIRNRSIGIFVFDPRFSINDHTTAIFKNFKKENCKIITVFNHKGFDLEEEEGRESRFSIARQLYELVVEKPHTARSIDQADTIIKDLLAYDVFFVDAKRAWNGKVESKPTKIEESGINTLEKLLGTLVSDEMKSKIKTGAEEKLLKSLQNRSNQLKVQIDRLHADIKASGAKVDKQTQQNESVKEDHEKVKDIVIKHRDNTIKEVLDSLKTFLDSFPEKIIDLISRDYSLYETSFELNGILEKFIEDEFSTWEAQEGSVILLKNKGLLEKELIQFKDLKNQPNKHLSLSTSVDLNAAIPAWERVLASAGGLFLGGVVSAAAGASMGAEGALVAVGFKAIALSIGGALGFGLIPLIIGILVAEIVAVAMSADGIKAKIKRKVLSDSQETIQKIEKEAKEKISQFVRESYNTVLYEANKSFNEMAANEEKVLTTVKSTEEENQKKHNAAIRTLTTKKETIDTTIETIKVALN